MLLSGYAFCENRRREDRAFVVHVNEIRYVFCEAVWHLVTKERFGNVTEYTTCSPVETCPRSAIEMHNWKALQTAPYLVWLKAQSGAGLYSHVALRDECQGTRNLTERDNEDGHICRPICRPETMPVEIRDTGGPASLSDPRAHRGVPRHAPFVTDVGTHGRALIVICKCYAVMLVECWLLTTT